MGVMMQSASSENGIKMSRAVAVLKKGEGRTLKNGGMWIYDNEIASCMGHFENGDLLQVHDFDGYPMGIGFINTNSRITIRMLTRNAQTNIDENFLRSRLQSAWDYRKRTVDTSSCRIVFGEADLLPGLVIDKYADVLVVQVSALGMDRMKYLMVRLMKEILEEDGITIRGVYERSDGHYRDQEGIDRVNGFIGPAFDTKVEIVENGVHYYVDTANGQKTGFFLDQKYNRKAVGRLCRGFDVLDCFTHTGSFALNAGLGGAKSVLGIDASELAVEQARENARLNGLQDTVHFQTGDVFSFLDEQARAKKQYDLIILDPPAFTKSKNSVKAALRGYRQINSSAMKLIRNGGYLATCSCSHFMTPDLFRKMLMQASIAAHVHLRQIEVRTQAPDHPFFWTSEDSYYLKFFIFQLFSSREI